MALQLKWTIDQYQEAVAGFVAAGIRKLEKVTPDWFTRVAIRDLDMSDACSCILGQTHGNYLPGLRELVPATYVKMIGPDGSYQIKAPATKWAVAHGFDVPVGAEIFTTESSSRVSNGAYYNVLRAEWVHQIRVRVDAASAAHGS